MNPCISVGIVTYNSENDIYDCIELLTSPLIERIFVIDNDSNDSTKKKVDEIESNSPMNIDFVEMGGNFGFGWACNKAIELSDTKYVLILNPDVRINQNSIEELLKHIENDDIGATVPKITKNGILQKSLRRFPSSTRSAFEAIVGGKIMRIFNVSEIYTNHSFYEQNRLIDWATGACWLLKKDDVINVGGFSDKWFLYSEETELAYKMQNSGKKILYCSNSIVEHSSGAQHSNIFLYTLSQANKMRFLQQIKERKLTLVYLCFIIGFFMRLGKPQARYCFKEFVLSNNNMDLIAKKMISNLDGEVPDSLC